MTNAFSVLSLKRNRSTSNCKSSSSERVSKLSRLKSGFSIFSKCTNQNQQQAKKNNENKQNPFIDFFNYYFRSIDDTVNNNSRLRRKNTYESDKNYEYNQYRRAARKKKMALHAERNVYTVPTPKKLKSILVKHNPSIADLVTETPIPIRYSNDNIDSNSNNFNTTNSEHLTAKEFADIAGIRILPEDEDSVIYTMSSQTPSFFGPNEHLTETSHVSSNTSRETPKIWDNGFWLNPEDQVSRNNSTHKPTVLEPMEPPILHELRRMGTCNSDKSSVIRKGRFEIHLDYGK